MSHYAVSKTVIFKANRTSTVVDVDFDKAKLEWSGFKDLMFQKRENYYHLINSKIAAVQSPGNKGKTAVTNLKKRHYVLSKVTLAWESFSNDNPIRQLAIPNLILFVAHIKYTPFECSLC